MRAVMSVAPLRVLMAAAFGLVVFMMPSAQAKIITAPSFQLSAHAEVAHLPFANPLAKKGGTLSLAAQGSFDSLNPFIDKGVAAQGSFYLYDSLMASSLDELGVSHPQLAEQVTFDDTDDSWVIFHIHPKARFWDGSPVTAADVQATFEMILAEGRVSWQSYLSGIETMTVLDDRRIKFTFAKGQGETLRGAVAAMPIFSKKNLKENFSKPSLTPLMGSGAYQVDKVVAGRSVSYVRNPDYWGWALMVNVGRFNFDYIRYQYYHSDAVALEAFKAGQYLFHIEKNAKLWAHAHKLPQVKSGDVLQRVITDANPIPFYGLMINTRKAPLDDIALRQALVMAFDFDWTNRALLYGQKQRLSSYFQGSALQAPSQTETALDDLLTRLPLSQAERHALKSPMQVVTSARHRSALLNARRHLLSAGYHFKQGQLFDKRGQAVTLEILVSDDSLNRVLLPYLSNLARLGIRARIRQMDKAGFYERRREFDFDMTPTLIYQGNQPSHEQAYLWGSQAAFEHGSQNLAGVRSAAVDALIALLSAKPSPAQSNQSKPEQTKPKQTRTKPNTAKSNIAKSQNQLPDASNHRLYVQALDRLLMAGAYAVPLYADAGTQLLYDKRYQPPTLMPRYALGLDYWWWMDTP